MSNIFTADDPVVIASQALSCARRLRAVAKPDAAVPLAPEAQRRLQGLLGTIDQNGLFAEPVLDQLSTLLRWCERVPVVGPGAPTTFSAIVTDTTPSRTRPIRTIRRQPRAR